MYHNTGSIDYMAQMRLGKLAGHCSNASSQVIETSFHRLTVQLSGNQCGTDFFEKNASCTGRKLAATAHVFNPGHHLRML